MIPVQVVKVMVCDDGPNAGHASMTVDVEGMETVGGAMHIPCLRA